MDLIIASPSGAAIKADAVTKSEHILVGHSLHRKERQLSLLVDLIFSSWINEGMVPPGWYRGNALIFELSGLVSIADRTINCQIGALRAGRCTTKCAVPQMDVKLEA